MNDLKKVYIIKKKVDGRATMGPTNPMVEAFLKHVFIQIDENYRGAPINLDAQYPFPYRSAIGPATDTRGAVGMPVFKFGARDLCNNLLERGIVSREQLYSPTDLVSRASNKKSFYRLMEGRNMPNTKFTQEGARSLNYPIVVKPINGWAGKGVRIISSASNLPAPGKLVYQEHIKIAHEYRFTMVKDKVIFVAERIPSNDKARSIREGRETTRDPYTRNKFSWKRYSFPLYGWYAEATRICQDAMRRTQLGVSGLDVAVTTEDKVYLIECNTSPGMTFDQSVLLYQAIFEDWYGRPVDNETKQTLDLFGEILETARKKYVASNYAPES